MKFLENALNLTSPILPPSSASFLIKNGYWSFFRLLRDRKSKDKESRVEIKENNMALARYIGFRNSLDNDMQGRWKKGFNNSSLSFRQLQIAFNCERFFIISQFKLHFAADNTFVLFYCDDCKAGELFMSTSIRFRESFLISIFKSCWNLLRLMIERKKV